MVTGTQHHHRAVVGTRIDRVSATENYKCFWSIEKLIESVGNDDIEIEADEPIVNISVSLPTVIKHP